MNAKRRKDIILCKKKGRKEAQVVTRDMMCVCICWLVVFFLALR